MQTTEKNAYNQNVCKRDECQENVFRLEQTDKSTPYVLKYRILCKVSFTTWGVFEVALLRNRPVCQLTFSAVCQLSLRQY